MDNPIPVTQKAKLKSLGPDRTEVTVHFNPASLVYTIENSTKQQAADPKRRQFAAQFSGKLTMDLQFDTTGTGVDVRQTTNKVAMFMQASANAGKNQSSGNAQAQPVLSFQWGSYEFKGIMESFKETIDFFSADGVPLRALVSIGLARQDHVFDEGAKFSKAKVAGTLGTPGSVVPTGRNNNLTSLSTLGGDPDAARQLGADNGLDSLRFTAGASLNVSAGIQLNAAADFSASASASASAGAGLSIGGSAGGGLSLGAGAGVAATASLQISAGVGGGALFGGPASAGIPATANAFAGLEVGRATMSTTTGLNPLRMLPATVSTDVSTGVNASFSLGGAANAGSGFSTDVGTSFNFSDRLVFDDD
ncbi:MAG TPA: hypothetical protein VGK48_20195 [Terriglobia bacterium]|jgi:hypothetical protein